RKDGSFCPACPRDGPRRPLRLPVPRLGSASTRSKCCSKPALPAPVSTSCSGTGKSSPPRAELFRRPAAADRGWAWSVRVRDHDRPSGYFSRLKPPVGFERVVERVALDFGPDLSRAVHGDDFVQLLDRAPVGAGDD